MHKQTVMLAGLLFGCGGGEPVTKEGLVGGKADDAAWTKACREAGLEAGCDLCTAYGWYEDDVCDAFCLEHDPSCSAATADGWDLLFGVRDADAAGSIVYFEDVAFLGDDLLALRAVESGETWSSELVRIGAALETVSTRPIAGFPGRVLVTPDHVAVVTRASALSSGDEPRHHLLLLPR